MGSHISTSAGHLHWKDYGGNGPNLVLVHGLGGSIANWDAIGPKLAEDHRTVAFDLPGFGLSAPAADWELRTLAGSLAAFIREIGESATLVGNSLGGLLSMMVAATEPSLIDDLVLISPAIPPRLNSNIDWPTARRVAIQATPGLGRLVTRRYLEKYEPRELIDLTLTAIMENTSRVSMAMMQSFVTVAEIRRELPMGRVCGSFNVDLDSEDVRSPFIVCRGGPGDSGTNPGYPRCRRPTRVHGNDSMAQLSPT